MNEVKFLFNSNEGETKIDIYHKIEIAYKEDGLFCINGGGGFCLYLGESYINIGIDGNNKRVENFGGLFNLKETKNASIELPKKVVKGLLYVNSEKEFKDGFATRIVFSEKRLYDIKNKVLQIGEYDPNKLSLQFFKNAYAQLSKDGVLEGIIITGI
ncbi:MAG: hypothetical protein AB7S44_03245 [Spirochaetales bacterium]